MKRKATLLCCVVCIAACSGSDEQQAALSAQADPAPPPAQPATTPGHAHAPTPSPMPAIPEGAKVSFLEPSNGATVKGSLADGKIKVAVKMGAEGIAVKPAGPIEEGSGHHHILIDVEPAGAGAVVPADEQHIHFGKAQTETELALSPGEHTLILQFADGIHRAYGPALTDTIKLTIEAE